MKFPQLLLTSLFCCLIAVAVCAQDTVTGAFEGTVTNSQDGAPIAGASAEIINVETGITLSKTTDSRGRFYQGLLAPGLYRIRVSVQGFQTREVIQRLNISRTGEVVPVPVSLDPVTAVAQVAQPVVTTPPAPTPAPAAPAPSAATELRASINTTDASRRGAFNETQVSRLPLGGSTLTSTFDELALLLPGVAPPPQTLGSVAGPGQGAGVGTAGQFAVNGLRSRGNNFTVDGSDNNDEDIGVRRQGFTALVPQPIESIKEYQAITLLAPAQFGRNFGGIVNAVSKSGGNQVHGALYGFFNSSQLNARNRFDTANGTAERQLRAGNNQLVTLDNQPLTVRNQSGGEDSFTLGKFGGTVGGPLKRERTFFFLAGEGQVLNATQEESFAVPAVEQRSAFGTAATGIFEDPFTGLPDYAFPVNPNGALIWSLFPFPNHPEGIYDRNTFTQLLPASARGSVLSAKLDHHFKLAERVQSVTGRYNFTDDWREIPVTGGALFSALRPRTRAQNFSFFLNSELNARVAAREKFNQVRLSYGRTRLRFDEIGGYVCNETGRTACLLPRRSFAATPFLLNVPWINNRTLPIATGLPNTGPVNYRRVLSQGQPADFESVRFLLGQVNVAGFSPVGVDVYNFPQARVNNTYQAADIFTWRAGNHSLAFGGDARRTELHSDLPRVARPLVTYNGGPRAVINGDGSFRLAGPNDQRPLLRPEDLVSLDAPNAFFLTLNTGNSDARISLRFYQLDFFAQDAWRIRPNLSLAFGLRYEYNTVPRELNNRIEQTFNDPALDRVPGFRVFLAGRSEIFEPDRDNFAPRLSLAYRPSLFGSNRVSVLRAGYGMFYDQVLGAVVSQSRNVFPTFLTLNFGGLRAFNTFGAISSINPANTRIRGVPLVTPCTQDAPCTVNQLNPALGLAQLLDFLTAGAGAPQNRPFPDALGATLPARQLEMPIAQHYALTFEQQLNANHSLALAYVGTQGRHLLRFTTPNQGPGATIAGAVFGGTADPSISGRILAPARAVNGVGAIYLFETSANSRYDALQIEARGRLGESLQYFASYTLARAADDVSDVFDLAGASALPQNSLNLAAERGPANFDIRQRMTQTLTVDFSAWRGAGWRRGLNGLQLVGKGQFQTGQPFTVNTLFDINRDGNLTDRLNTTEGLLPTHTGQQPMLVQTSDLLRLLAPIGQDGRVNRNSFRAGGLALLDAAVSKQFKLSSAQALDLRIEFFNLFNHHNFAIPVRWLEAPGFGKATRTVTPGARVQFALKYVF